VGHKVCLNGKIRGWVHGLAPPAKRPGVRRILTLGDSVTYGIGVELADAWPQVLERALGQAEVFNFAIPGWDAEQNVTLTTSTLEDWQPDMVIWGSSPNDVLPTYLMWGADDAHPVFVGTSVPEGVPPVPEWLTLFLVRHSSLMRQWLAGRMAQQQQAGLVLGSDVDWYRDQLAKLRQWSEDTNIPVMVMAIPAHTQANPSTCAQWVNEHDCQAQAERYRVLTSELSAAGMFWLDGQRAYAASGRPNFMLQPGEKPGPGAWENDAEHPTAAGHQALVAGLLDVVRSRL
jgi:lysophospholipase L1-like esterase